MWIIIVVFIINGEAQEYTYDYQHNHEPQQFVTQAACKQALLGVLSIEEQVQGAKASCYQLRDPFKETTS